MSEDLIERLTSKLFEDEVFSDFVVHQLCGFLTRESDEVYLKMRTEFKDCIPKDVGINNYFTSSQLKDDIYKQRLKMTYTVCT